MPIGAEIEPTPSTLAFLRRSFQFVSVEWPHAEREQLPDAGFEQRFRESCVQNLDGWTISEPRELWLGSGLDPASGIEHEIDIVARRLGSTAAAEVKNLGDGPGKNDVIIFHAKLLDYLLANPDLASQELCLVFMSRNSFEPRGLAACLGLGIHPVASDIRPFPILVDNALRMEHELQNGLALPSEVHDHFEDYCASLNRMGYDLKDTWPDNRFGYLSEDTLLVKALVTPPVDDLATQLRQANADCVDLLHSFRTALST